MLGNTLQSAKNHNNRHVPNHKSYLGLFMNILMMDVKNLISDL